MHLWDRLLPQCDYTLNMLRASRLHPTLSTYHQLHGHFDFNATPMTPPGTKILIHEKPKQRGSWTVHGEDGWYTSPAINHYRCYHCYCISTATPRYADTVEFFPTVVQMPHPSSIELATQAALDLSVELQNPSPSTPFARYGDGQLRALRLLQNIFQQVLPPTFSKNTQPVDKINLDFQALVQQEATTLTQQHI